jgi:hypothetical protein
MNASEDSLSCFHSSASASQYSISLLATAARSRHMSSKDSNRLLELTQSLLDEDSTALTLSSSLRPPTYSFVTRHGAREFVAERFNLDYSTGAPAFCRTGDDPQRQCGERVAPSECDRPRLGMSRAKQRSRTLFRASVSVRSQALIYSLTCIGVGVAVAPARASAARLILFMPSFRTAFLARNQCSTRWRCQRLR